MASQVVNGKAFEFALLDEFHQRLKVLTSVTVNKNEPYETAKGFFNSFNEKEQETFRITASSAINFLIDIEPRLSNGISKGDILALEIASDQMGQSEIGRASCRERE